MTSQTIFEREFYETMLKVSRTIEKNEARLVELDRREFIKTEWQEVALVVDRLLLLVFIGMTVGITLSILLRAPHSLDFVFGTGAVDASLAASRQMTAQVLSPPEAVTAASSANASP